MNPKKIAEKKYLIFCSFVLGYMPFLFVSNTNELFEFPKTFFVYFATLALIIMFSYDFLFREEEAVTPDLQLLKLHGKFKFLKPPIPVLLYLLSLIVSTLFSSHLYTSVFGYYTRFFGGIISVFCAMLFYYIGKIVLTKEDSQKIMFVVMLTVAPVSIFGILQYSGLLSYYSWLGEDISRVYSSFGQPNWLAQYLVMTLPLIFYHSLGENRKNFWSVIYLLGYACLWFTFSMSGITSFTTATGVLFVVLYFKKDLKKVYKKAGVLILLSMLISILFPGLFKNRIHDVLKDVNISAEDTVVAVYAQDSQNPPTGSLPDTTGYKVSDPGFIRLGLWKGTLNLIISSPKVFLIGTGPETFPYRFQPYRTPELNYSSEWNFIFNKPHNYYLQLWSETGLLGLSAYLILLGYLARKADKFFLPVIIGFAVSNIFGWPSAYAVILFWFWLLYAEVQSE